MPHLTPTFIIHGGTWLNFASAVELDVIIRDGTTLNNAAVDAGGSHHA